jgi:hypothetical protein
MSAPPKKLLVAAVALCCLPRMAQPQLESVPQAGPATKLSAVTYFDPPHEQQINLRVSGAEMSPLPGTLFDVKQLMVEQFNAEGKLQAVVQAPQCVYAPLDNVAKSAGHLDLQLDGDRIHIQGEGFLWQQKEQSLMISNQLQKVTEQSLVISNQVRTIIKMGNWKLTTP